MAVALSSLRHSIIPAPSEQRDGDSVIATFADLQSFIWHEPACKRSFRNSGLATRAAICLAGSLLLTTACMGASAAPQFETAQDTPNTRMFASQSAELLVRPRGAPNLRVMEKDRDAFLRLIVPKTSVYLGEVFEVNLKLYALSPHDLNMPQIQAEGFTLSDMAQPARSRTQIGETIYQVFSFATAATPAKTGLLSLGPAECTLVLRLRKHSDPSEPMADIFGDGTELRQITIQSEPVSVEVLAFPEEHRPADFTGAAGNFSLSITASPTNAAVGDPIIVRIEIAGQGSFKELTLPKNQRQWREFRTYPPTSRIETSDPLGFRGIKIFEQVVVPQNSAIKELPSLSFSFFDPDRKVYETLSQPPIRLSIKPAFKSPARPIVLARSPGATDLFERRDIIHIKTHIGKLDGIPKPLVTQTWFLSLQGISLILWASVFVWKKRQGRLEGDPKLNRKLRVQRLARENLKELDRFSKTEQTEAFFAMTFRLLQETLGERFALPACTITEAVLDEHLSSHVAHEELLSELHFIFHLCNQAKYAPAGTSLDLKRLTLRIKKVIQSLEELNREPTT